MLLKITFNLKCLVAVSETLKVAFMATSFAAYFKCGAKKFILAGFFPNKGKRTI
jgi:hypothetical protein